MEKNSRSASFGERDPNHDAKRNGVVDRAENDEAEAAAVAAVPRSKSKSFFKSLKKHFGGSSRRKLRHEKKANNHYLDRDASPPTPSQRSATLPAKRSISSSSQFADHRTTVHEFRPTAAATPPTLQHSSAIQLLEANSVEDLVGERRPEPLPAEAVAAAATTASRYSSPPASEVPIYDTAAVARAFGPLRDVGRWYSHEQERRRQRPHPLPLPPIPPPAAETSTPDYSVEEVVYTRVAPLLGSGPQQQQGQIVMRALKDLSLHGWYWGPLTRQEAEEKLDQMQNGAFLVRDSSDDRYLLSLSFRSQGRTLHTRIEYFNGRFSFYQHREADGYPTVVELIQKSVEDSREGIFCYSRGRGANARSYPVRLTRPLSRFIHVRSLQHHCRFVIRQLTRFDLIQQLPLPTGMKGFLKESKY